MKKVEKALLTEIYELNSAGKKIHDEQELAGDEHDGLSKETLENLELIDSQIHNRLTEIAEKQGMNTAMIVWGLLVGIGHLSISRFFGCLQVCGVEVEE